MRKERREGKLFKDEHKTNSEMREREKKTQWREREREREKRERERGKTDNMAGI